MTSVLIVEDHPLVAEATAKLLGNLSRGLETVLVATASDAVQQLAARSWFRIFLDLAVPGAYGLSLASEVERHGLASVCCVVSAFERTDYVEEVRRRGFAGYIVKAASVAQFASAVSEVLDGHKVFPVIPGARREPAVRLTRRQVEILERIRRGQSSKQVARDVHISEGTVNNHVTAVLQALGASSRTEAVARAIELGLLRPFEPSDPVELHRALPA